MSAAGPLALTPEIDDFRRQFEQLSADADALVAPLSDTQLHWRSAPDSWSVAQCIEHLNVTARLYLPFLDEAIANAIRRGLYGPGPFRYNWIGRLVVFSQGPPPRFRTRAPATFEPTAERPRKEIMAAFRAYQVQYIDRLRQANGIDLARARVRSPSPYRVRMPLGSGFAFAAAHGRRHLWQARQVIAQLSRAAETRRRGDDLA
ncbi:MAG TPA: DinB family protein [Vicinamibacterales bacterium]